MILKQGHKYEPMPHDGKLIDRIYRGGRCYYKDSPYSLAATQALKAAFPQYWTAIRNYGVAHPQLVPFINEDPMLIVSLVETGKTRWLVGDGKAYINSGIVLTRDAVITEAKAIYTHTNNTNNAICGSYSTSSAYYTISSWNSKYFVAYGGPSSYTQSIIIDRPTEFRVECLNGTGAYYIDGKQIASSNLSSFTTLNQYIMARNDGGTANLMSLHKVGYVRYKNADENLVKYFVPCQHGGEAGMLDIVSLTFYPNANTSGSFTIQLTDKA